MSRRNSLRLLVLVSLVLGMVGPAAVVPAHRVQAQDVHIQAGSVTLDNTVGSTPTVDSTYTTGTANNANSITFSHTTGSGSNRLLLVGVSWSSTTVTVTGIKFNSVPLTLKGTQYYTSQARRVAIYYLVAPTASTTADVVVSFSAAVYGVAGAVSFAGVDQCTPLGTQLGATGNTATATVSPVTVAGDLVFDTVAAGTALTVNGSQAQQWMSGDGTTIYGGASTKTATGTPTAMSWTLTSGYWATIAVGIKPVNPAPKTATASSGTAITFCQTTGTGTNRLMLVGVSLNANTTATSITSITFTPIGGSPLTLSPVIWEQNPWVYRYAGISSLVIPPSVPSGQGGNVVVTLSAAISSGAAAVGAANFAGVDTTTPLGPAKGADGVSGSTSLTLNGLDGDELVFDDLFVGGTSTSATAGTGQTQVPGWNAFLSNARGAASTEQAAGSSVTMDWSLTASGSYIWSDAAVPIIPACTGARYTLTAGYDSNGTGVTLIPPGGSYCDGRIVTLTPVPNSGYLFNSWSGANGSDVVSSSGVYRIVMNGDKSITANFATPICQDVSLPVDDDTYLSSGATTTNYGNATTLQVDEAGTQRTALLRWNVGSIPSNASITSASIVLNVTDPSTIAYSLYDVGKPWVEGTGAAASGATWATYNGTIGWQTAGASAITGALDRGDKNLWSSTITSFSTAGPSTVALNADGLNAVRRWVAGGSNNGVIIQTYSGSSNTLYFDSAESIANTPTPGIPPALNINYCLGVPPSFTVTFDANGGTGSMSPQTASAPTALTANAFTRTGYSFSGWNTQAGGGGTAYADGATYPFTANVTLYAQWTALYTVTFDANGGTGSMSPQTAGAPTALTLNTFTRTGYSFSGWNTAANGSGTSYADGATYSFAADITLYAQWSALPNHTVTFDANGGTGTMSPQITNVPTALTLNTFARTCYSFSGWNTQADGLGTSYADGATYSFSADINLYAQWTALPQYTLTADDDGNGYVDLSPGGGTYCTGTIVTLTPVPNACYAFDHWSGDNAGDLTDNGDGTWSITMNGNKSVTANFALMQYYLVADSNGNGSVTLSPPPGAYNRGTTVAVMLTPPGGSYNCGTTVTLTPVPDPCYTFDHWSGANAGDLTDNHNGTWSITMNEGKSVMANFVPIQYTLTAGNDGHGSVTLGPPGGTYDCDTTVTLTPSPDPCYTFGSWSGANAGDLTDNHDGTWSMVMNGNKSVTANFAFTQYTLTASDDGNGYVNLDPASGPYCAGSSVTLTPVPNDADYTFSGWVGANKDDIINVGGQDMILMNGNKSVIANFYLTDSGNSPPELLYLEYPTSGMTNVNPLSPMGVTVGDADGNLMNVEFWVEDMGSAGMASAQAPFLAGTAYGVASGGLAHIRPTGLTTGRTYNWYVEITDGNAITGAPTPSIWTFDTATPTEAELTSFNANPARGSILLKWDTASDLGNLGFQVWRATSVNGARGRLTEDLIPTQAPGSADAGHYQFVDETAIPGLTYYYWVERVGVDGVTQVHGPIHATARLYFKPPPARE